MSDSDLTFYDGIEYERNELYESWQKKLSRLPKLHPKSCSDKCGCFVKTSEYKIFKEIDGIKPLLL